MDQPYGTPAKPILVNVPFSRGHATFYSLRQDTFTRWGIQLGHSNDGSPIKFDAGYSNPKNFNKHYTYDQYQAAPKVDGKDYVDPETQRIVKGRFLDGFEIDGITVWEARQAAKRNWDAVYEEEGAEVSGAEFHPVK